MMDRKRSRSWALVIALCALAAGGATAQGRIGLGLCAGAEVDPNPGFGGALGANFQYLSPGGALEVGPIAVFEGYGKTYDEEYVGTVQESGKASVYGVLVNWVWNYDPGRSAPFFLMGSGFGRASTVWKKLYDDGSSDKGTSSPSAVSLNAGIGLTLSGGFEIRAVLPVFFTVGEDDESILPVLLLMAGYHLDLGR